MADDANALTTTPDRLPTEADYEAICATVMQTARGRWFLAEFARRNRNADTRMVLDAVDRIEAAMARTPQPTDRGPIDHEPAIAAAMANARARAAEIAACTTEAATIVQESVQALREITWTLREWGTDSGLCDQLDSHVTAIAESSEAATRAASVEAMRAIFGESGSGESAAAVLPPPAAEPDAAPARGVDPVAALQAAIAARVATPAPAPASNVSAAVAALKPQTLGAALLDQGLVAPPRGNDPLAPLRRMTQAEKIALFT
jgi:hypothetical protein